MASQTVIARAAPSGFKESDFSAKGSKQDKSVPEKPGFLKTDPEFTRSDWQAYISDLPRKAGVPPNKIRMLVLKELADNALDEMDRVGQPGAVTITQDGNACTVTDQGRGFDDTPGQLAYRFSIAKPMVSSKQWRKPTRGCVGNGLRVIVGSVASGGGCITVKTRNQEVVLRPRLNGSTVVERVTPIDWPVGSAITIEINPAYPASDDDGDLLWANLAAYLARSSGPPFSRKPSVWWFDANHLALNMLAAVGGEYTLAAFVKNLDRCTGGEIGQLVTSNFGKGCLCQDVSRPGAAELLMMLRQAIPERIKPKQLGAMGRDAFKHLGLCDGYAYCEGSFAAGLETPRALIPFLVEVWAATREPGEEDDCAIDIVCFSINRSPAIVQCDADRYGRARSAHLSIGDTTCSLNIPKGSFKFAVNITSPYVEILGDNKNPSLECFKAHIAEAVEAAIKRSARNNPPVLFQRDNSDSDEDQVPKAAAKISQKEAVLTVLQRAIDGAWIGEDGRTYKFGQRNLYYRVRELVKIKLPLCELKFPYFTSLITDYEAEHGDIKDMIRDSRGVFSEPHGGDMVPMGTVTVEAYSRTPWRYSTVIFLEKEDQVSLLKQNGFTERWDCFVTSSKGFGTRAVKDLIDKIGRTGELTKFFSVHDADAAGPLIGQTLTAATKARGVRTVEVIDLGLFPWDALKAGLPAEKVARGEHHKPVAECIKERDRKNKESGNPDNEPNWEEWLQTNRIELNAMTAEQLIHWLDKEFERHGVSKVIPPAELLEAEVRERTWGYINQAIEDRVMLEVRPRITAEATEAFEKVDFPNAAEILETILEAYGDNPSVYWDEVVSGCAAELSLVS